MGKLVQLEVNNFKSYRGHHVLLFGDAYFTSIIGPNGSGKSNSMDAISFVLGIKSSHLRSTQLRDLIYRGRVIRTNKINADGTVTEATNGDAEHQDNANGESQTSSQRNDPQSAWVMAVYQGDGGEEIKWKRTITSAGQSEYRINSRVVTAKQYNEALEAENILIKARNFLVFQGDVEAVASQSPKDLTRLIEQISGSLEHKADYDRLKVESEKAMDDQTFKLNQRRAINAEVKTYQEQKKEADEWQAKVTERDEAIVKHVLWKLFHFQQTMEESSNEIAKHQEELKEHNRGLEKYRQRVEEARQAHAKVTRDVTKTSNAIKGKEKEIENAQNELVPIDEKISLSNGSLESFNSRIASLRNDRDKQERLIEKWKKDLATVQKAQEKWEGEFAAAAQQQGRELSAADLQEYNRLRGDVTKQTHQNAIEVNRLTREVKTAQDETNSLKSKVESSQAYVQRLEEEIQELQQRQQNLKQQTKDLDKEKAAKQLEFNKLQDERNNVLRQQTDFNERLQETMRKLNEADTGRRQSEKEVRSREAVAQMKRIFGAGVHGRYKDLVRPKQKKYDTAVSTLLGRNMDAIIVDTHKLAQDCITYLKEQKIGQFNFVPLDTVAIKAINSNLKGTHRNMRLAIDCIDYDSSLERAMNHACGSSIICDDLKTAKYLCYEKQVGVKAVTLEGTVIAKGGQMTGGTTTSDKGGKVWGDQEIDRLLKLKDQWLKKLEELPKARRTQEEEKLQGDIAELEMRVRLAQDELKALDRNLQDKKKELQFHKNQLRETQPKYQQRSQGLHNIEVELRRYQDAVDQVADTVFAAFCQRLGYSSIRDYESQQGTVQQEAAERRLEFTKQRSRLENQISYHNTQLQSVEQRIEEAEAKAERDKTQVAALEEEKERMQESIDELTAQLEELQERRRAAQEKQEERAAVVEQQRRELNKRDASVKDVLKTVDALEAEIKRTAASRYALLRKCKVDQISLPLAEESSPLNSLPMGDLAQQDADAMDVDEDPDSMQIEQPEVNDYGIEVDFDGLDEDLKEDKSNACEAKLQEEINNLTAEIEKSQPNTKAFARLEATTARMKDTEKDFKAARRIADKAKEDFEEVKQRRMELFQKAFSHISEQIGSTYRDLTKSTAFPLGGQAYLDMEDSTEPYLAGLKYHAMPPLKRFRDMEHLSGGEKTIAALALLFAIHSYQPSPFFVLDEVDAALDNVNVGRVAKYVKQHANPGMQFIVISLKTGFFQESEGLVGVMRDQSKMSSRVVSLDLRKYRDS